MALNGNDPDIRNLLSQVCNRYEVNWGGLAERKLFSELFASYTGGDDLAEIERWLDEQVPLKFPALNKRPLWLQGAEWPFANDLPMIFIGQIDIGLDNTADFKKYFHDYTSFYVFLPQGRGNFSVVMQQM